jgi:hypothetical protein
VPPCANQNCQRDDERICVAHLYKRHIKDLNSRAFVPVTPPSTEESPPIIIRIATGPWFSRSAHTPKVSLGRRHHMHPDPRILPSPPRLRHLTPSHTTSMHRGRDNVRVIRVRSASPHTWVPWSYTGQCEGGDVERCTRDCTIAWQWKGAERVHKGAEMYRWRYWARARVRHR